MQAAAAVAALLLLLSPIAVARLTAISDGNIISAVSEWTTSPTTATTMYGDIGGWNVAAVTSMSNLFNNKPTFNAEIGGWNTSSVSNMYHMFRDSAFNANIGRWYAYHEHYGT
jgi:hypothetical protein